MKNHLAIFSLAISLLLSCELHSQALDWVKRMGSTGWDFAESTAVDAFGNVYTTGAFNGTVDFDPGAGTFNLTSVGGMDIFISKLDSAGNFRWAKSIGGTSSDRGYSIATDSAGNVYTFGDFSLTADFDPGQGVFNLASAGTVNAFISKLDSAGNFVWAKQLGGPGSAYGRSIVLDEVGNVYTTGQFVATVDFDPGPAVFNLSHVGIGNDIFISKLDSNGNFLWAKRIGGPQHDFGYDITLDAFGHVLTCGEFRQTADFDPGTGTFNLTSDNENVFISKLDTAGNFVWAKQLGGPNSDYAYGIATDPSGNVYTTGSFDLVADFDPGPAIFNITAAGTNSVVDGFLSKLDSAGNFVWAIRIGGVAQDEGRSVFVEPPSSVYCTGIFRRTADFDPSPGVYNLTATGGSGDVFVVNYDTSGSLTWARGFGGPFTEESNSITTNGLGSVYTSGYFGGTADFDPGVDTFNLTEIGAGDIFVHKIRACSNSSSTISATACDSYVSPSGKYTWISSGSFMDTLANTTGCDSIITINLTLNNTFSTDVQVACDSYTWIDGNTYTTSNNTATDTLINAVGCDSIITLDLTVNYSTAGTDSVVDCDSYTWIDGNTYTNSNSTATHVLANAAGCDSVVTLNLTMNYTDVQTDVVTACDSYTWINGVTYTTSNNSASQTFTNVAGCDSIVTLDLTINYSNTATDVITACDSYTWIDGNTYTASNTTATHTLINVSGCDSVVTLNLTVNHSSSSTDTITACDQYTWIDGNTYTSSNSTAVHVLTNAAGCDSVITLALTMNYSTTYTDTVIACDSYTWIDGNTYTASDTTATRTLTNVAGCDSVVTLHLTMNYSSSSADTITACKSYTWIDGTTYTASAATATHTLINAAGCDSVVTLNLTIDTVDVSVTNTSPLLTANATGATYQWIDCDNGSSPINGETNSSYLATVSGNYAVVVTQNNCTDTSACEAVTNVSVTENSFQNSISVFPNPTNGQLTLNLGNSYDDVTVTVRNAIGQELLHRMYPAAQAVDLNIDGERGMYLIEVTAGDRKAVFKVVKE